MNCLGLITRITFSIYNCFFFYFLGWLGAMSMSVSFLISPIVIGFCRRKSTRLTAVMGGLVTALGCLFTSFASQFHQLFFSYGAMIGNTNWSYDDYTDVFVSKPDVIRAWYYIYLPHFLGMNYYVNFWGGGIGS